MGSAIRSRSSSLSNVSEEARLSTSVPGPATVQRLGKNINGYLGETIDVAAVLADCVRAARFHGWIVGDIPVNEQLSLASFTRAGPLTSAEQPNTGRTDLRAYI